MYMKYFIGYFSDFLNAVDTILTANFKDEIDVSLPAQAGYDTSL